jgi:hypothetical protein
MRELCARKKIQEIIQHGAAVTSTLYIIEQQTVQFINEECLHIIALALIF